MSNPTYLTSTGTLAASGLRSIAATATDAGPRLVRFEYSQDSVSPESMMSSTMSTGECAGRHATLQRGGAQRAAADRRVPRDQNAHVEALRGPSVVEQPGGKSVEQVAVFTQLVRGPSERGRGPRSQDVLEHGHDLVPHSGPARLS